MGSIEYIAEGLPTAILMPLALRAKQSGAKGSFAFFEN
jgi:hypothetical protein